MTRPPPPLWCWWSFSTIFRQSATTALFDDTVDALMLLLLFVVDVAEATPLCKKLSLLIIFPVVFVPDEIWLYLQTGSSSFAQKLAPLLYHVVQAIRFHCVYPQRLPLLHWIYRDPLYWMSSFPSSATTLPAAGSGLVFITDSSALIAWPTRKKERNPISNTSNKYEFNNNRYTVYQLWFLLLLRSAFLQLILFCIQIIGARTRHSEWEQTSPPLEHEETKKYILAFGDTKQSVPTFVRTLAKIQSVGIKTTSLYFGAIPLYRHALSLGTHSSSCVLCSFKV